MNPPEPTTYIDCKGEYPPLPAPAQHELRSGNEPSHSSPFSTTLLNTACLRVHVMLPAFSLDFREYVAVSFAVVPKIFLSFFQALKIYANSQSFQKNR